MQWIIRFFQGLVKSKSSCHPSFGNLPKRHTSFFIFFIVSKLTVICAFHLCVEYDKTKWIPLNKIWYDIYFVITRVYMFLLIEKNYEFSYREFDLKDDLEGVPRTWYLPNQSFITLLKLVWRELDMVAMNNWRKKKRVGLQRIRVSKRTVSDTHVEYICHWNFFRNNKREKWDMPIKKIKHGWLFWKLNSTWNKVIIGSIFGELW